MYEIAKKYVMRFEKAKVVGVVMITYFLMLMFSFKLVGFENKVINILFYGIIPYASGLAYYLVVFFHNGAVKKMKIRVEESGYDVQHINADFLKGTKHQLFGGMLHIGIDYIIVCHKDESFVGKICDINRVSKDTDIERGSKYDTTEIERFHIKIEMLQTTVRAMCMNEAEADAVLEEFASRGILTVGCEDLLFEGAKRDIGYRSRM